MRAMPRPQPLTAAAVKPDTIERSNATARITGGMTAITPAALMKEELLVKSDVNEATMIGSVCDFGVWVNISARRNSFQLARNANSMTATTDGSASGK